MSTIQSQNPRRKLPAPNCSILTGRFKILEVEIFFRVVVAHVAYNFSEPLLVIRQLAIFNILANKIAQDPPEIFVSRE
jgi:hypothetical protein